MDGNEVSDRRLSPHPHNHTTPFPQHQTLSPAMACSIGKPGRVFAHTLWALKPDTLQILADASLEGILPSLQDLGRTSDSTSIAKGTRTLAGFPLPKDVLDKD